MRIGGQSNKSLKNLLLKSYEDFQNSRKNKIGNIFTLILKNILKIKQFFMKKILCTAPLHFISNLQNSGKLIFIMRIILLLMKQKKY